MLIVILALVAVAAPAQAATPAAPGIGDRLFPTLGNGGYDVKHYDLDLRYATSAPSQSIDGTATIFARATQSLSRFDLDFAGGGITAVTVNRRPANWSRSGDELVITPARSLRRGSHFVVRVAHFTATPRDPSGGVGATAFFVTPDGSATAPQPDVAHYVFPCLHRGLHRPRVAGRTPRPAGVPSGVALRHDHAADAGPSRLDC